MMNRGIPLVDVYKRQVITLCVFIPFALFYIGEKWKWDYLWAFLCVLGAVFFVNRELLFG